MLPRTRRVHAFLIQSHLMEPLESRALLSDFNGSYPGWQNIRMDLIRWNGVEVPGGAWDVTEGDGSVAVAVLDPDGVKWTDPDLADHLWSNPNDPIDGTDNDGNGFTDDIHGWNFVDFNNNTNEGSSAHGTTTAKWLAARGDDYGYGATGVNWNVQVIPMKYRTGQLFPAIYYLVDLRQRGVNIRVINISAREPDSFPNPFDQDAIQAAGNAGILVVAAAGNAPHRNLDSLPEYPPCYPLDNIIAATESDSSTPDQLTATANYGQTSVDIAAPGGYGTSFSTPEVSGLAALAFTVAPDASYQTIRDAVINGADHITTLDDYVAEGRRVNARKTLDLLTPASITINGDLNGTATNDTILVQKNGDNLKVLINGVEQPKLAKSLASLFSVAVNGIGGNDTITIDANLTIPMIIGGGAGNDMITGGGGDDTIVVGDPYNDASLVDWGTDSINGGGGTDTLRLKGGHFSVNGISDVETLEVDGTAKLDLSASATFSTVNIKDSTRVNLTSGGSKLLQASTLSIDSGATLDLNDGDMIVHNGDIADIASLVRSARHGGKWDREGLTSSTAQGAGNTTLGATLNDKGEESHTPILTSFDGQAVGNTDVLIKYTWAGDANLDGMVNADDYGQIDRGFISQRGGWYNGDFDYSAVQYPDVKVNADDYGMIDRSFTGQSGILGPMGGGDLGGGMLLDNPQFLRGLTIDLRDHATGGKSVQISDVGQVVTIDVYAVVVGSKSWSRQGLDIVMGSFVSTDVGQGAAVGDLLGAVSEDFQGTAQDSGLQQDLDGDGDLDVGSNDAELANGHFIARAGYIYWGPRGLQASFLIGTLTFTVTQLGAVGGETDINFVKREGIAESALWVEDYSPLTLMKDGLSPDYYVGEPIVLQR